MMALDFGLTWLLIGLGTLFWLVLIGFACYCYRSRRKRHSGGGRLRRDEEDEEQAVILPPEPKIQQQYYAMTAAGPGGNRSGSYGLAHKLRTLGAFRTPLIRHLLEFCHCFFLYWVSSRVRRWRWTYHSYPPRDRSFALALQLRIDP